MYDRYQCIINIYLWQMPCSFFNTALPRKVQEFSKDRGKKEKLAQDVELKVLLNESVRSAWEGQGNEYV